MASSGYAYNYANKNLSTAHACVMHVIDKFQSMAISYN